MSIIKKSEMDGKCDGSCSDETKEEDCYIVSSPLNIRKRVKLQVKVLEAHCHVDAALVPRKLRTAMSKRNCQSASPPLPDSKRRQLHASNGPPLCNNYSARFKENMMDVVTKDEEEVCDVLTSMANLVPVDKPVEIKLEETLLERNPEIKPPFSSQAPEIYDLIAPKIEDTKILVPCNGITATETFHCVEDSPKTMKADPSKLEQPTVVSVNQKFDAEAKGPPQSDFLTKLTSNIKPVENATDLIVDRNISNPPRASHQCFPRNRMLQPRLSEPLVAPQQELGLLLSGPTSMERDQQSFKQKPECVSHETSQKDTDGKPASHNRGHEKFTISSKTSTCPISATVSKRSDSRTGFPNEKMSADKKKHSWKTCATHVHISHLIQNYQKAEGKPREGTGCSVPPPVSSGLRNGTIPPLPSVSQMQRSMVEARSRMIQDGRLFQAQQAAALSEAYALRKQNYDLSLSVTGETMSSVNGMKSSAQLRVPYSTSQAALPFAFPRSSVPSLYQGHLAPGATPQAQLQLPHYMANNQLYGLHTGQAAGAALTKQQQLQQQLLWQAHLAHYKTPLGFPPKWPQQNSRQGETLSSPPVSQPPSIFPLPADYNLHNFHQPFSMPSMPASSLSALSSRSKQKPNGGVLNPQTSPQPQTISNAKKS